MKLLNDEYRENILAFFQFDEDALATQRLHEISQKNHNILTKTDKTYRDEKGRNVLHYLEPVPFLGNLRSASEFRI